MTRCPKIRRWTTGLLAGLCLLGPAACAAPMARETETPPAATPALTAAPAPSGRPEEEGFTLYEKYGVTAAIPNAYVDQLIVLTEPEWELEEGAYLLSVYEKRSYEDGRRDSGGDYAMGFLFSLARYTQAQYERFLCSDGSGQSFFARDDTYYYGYFTATDAQFYRSGDAVDTDGEDWKAWEALTEMGRGVAEDFIVRNGLTPYSDSEFFGRDFTYDGAHRYATYNDEGRWYALLLSQPAAQGQGGVWCVERWYDTNYGSQYYVFPTEEGAAEVYARLQAECDGGGRRELLDPVGAAEAFLAGYFDITPKPGGVQLVAGEPAGNVLRRCNEVFDELGALRAGTFGEDGALALLDALGPPDYYDRPFTSYAASRLYPLLWIRAERPEALSGGAVVCYSADGTKTLTFCAQDNLLCVDTDGTERWYQTAFPYTRTIYDRMYGFYEEFARAANPPPQHRYSEAEIQAATDAAFAYWNENAPGRTPDSVGYDVESSYAAAERWLKAGGGISGTAMENVIVVYASFTKDGADAEYEYVLTRKDAGSAWTVEHCAPVQ